MNSTVKRPVEVSITDIKNVYKFGLYVLAQFSQDKSDYTDYADLERTKNNVMALIVKELEKM
jgi:hypothetical protein